MQQPMPPYVPVPQAAIAARLMDETGTTYDHVVILPVRDETTDTLDNLLSLGISILVVAVINQGVSRIDDMPRNTAFLQHCKDAGQSKTEQTVTVTTQAGVNKNCGIVAIDKFTGRNRIAFGEGIGMCRKHGYDTACALIQQGVVLTPWIRSTDADATLSAAHFAPDVLPVDAPEVAAVFPFKYVISSDGKEAYDNTMRHDAVGWHLTMGLKEVGYPYHWYVLGSAMAVKHDAYVQAGGSRNIMAGEDSDLFYRVAFWGEVKEVQCPPIHLAARYSNRCPRGTGATASSLSRNENSSLHVPCPQFFDAVKGLLKGERPEAFSPEQWDFIVSIYGNFDRDNPKTLDIETVMSMQAYLRSIGYPKVKFS